MLKKSIILITFAVILNSFGCSFLNRQPIKLKELSNRQDWIKVEKRNIPKQIVQVRNIGGQGRARVSVTLSTSRGSYYQEQIIELKQDESRELEFIFSEVELNFLEEVLPKLPVEVRLEAVSDDTPLKKDQPKPAGSPECDPTVERCVPPLTTPKPKPTCNPITGENCPT